MTDTTAEQALAWRVEYDNDTGPDDESFWEWWEVTNGKRVYKSDKEQDAQFLCDLLNRQALTAPRVPEGWKLAGHVAVCGDGSVFYEYFAETADGISIAMAADGWEDMSVQPVYMLAAAPAPVDDGPVASIDDIWVASGKEYDRSIHSNPDHYAWAELFVSTFPNLRADIDTMAGWFANAMMAKVDSMRAHTAAPAPAELLDHNCATDGHLPIGWTGTVYCELCGEAIGTDDVLPDDQDDELAKLRERYDALLAKHQEVLDTVQQCACAYDKPQDVCVGHAKELATLRERVAELEDALRKMIGVPASAGFCEPIEGYVKRPHDAVDAMREMAASLRGGSDE